MHYNPIVRNFGRLRRVLMETLALPRDAIRPSARFADLVPREQRPLVWQRFRDEGMDIIDLTAPLSRTEEWLVSLLFSSLIGAFVVSTLLWQWLGACLALVGAVIAIVAACRLMPRRLATEIHPSITVGDAVMAMTSGRECRMADYRLNRKEIELKVRVILFSNAGANPAQIKPTTRFEDIFGGQ